VTRPWSLTVHLAVDGGRPQSGKLQENAVARSPSRSQASSPAWTRRPGPWTSHRQAEIAQSAAGVEHLVRRVGPRIFLGFNFSRPPELDLITQIRLHETQVIVSTPEWVNFDGTVNEPRPRLTQRSACHPAVPCAQVRGVKPVRLRPLAY